MIFKLIELIGAASGERDEPMYLTIEGKTKSVYTPIHQSNVTSGSTTVGVGPPLSPVLCGLGTASATLGPF